MQEKEFVCPQCQKPFSAPSNRLVQDTCGHRKCRSCLLEDTDNCKQCLVSFGNQKVEQANGVTDNRTAVIHCNGKAKFNSEIVITNEKACVDMEEGDNKHNIASNTSQDIEMEEKNVSNNKKKAVVAIPNHITVKSEPLSYLCTICNKTFVTKSHIKYHKYCTGELKPYKCEICSKEFILKVQLQIHMCKHNNVKPFKCGVCSKSFSEKSKLSRHTLLHSTGKNFICPECAKSFKTKESLSIHSMVHRNDKPFACKECPAKFNNSSNLKKHLVSHSDEKQHMCDQCRRRFKLKWALSVHRKSHSSVRPHRCSVCPKAFVNLKDLQRHVLIHTESKAFTCSICMTSFRRKDNVRRHIKNSHPGKKADIIKNPDVPKKSVFIDNPNAVNVITAPPALTKCRVAAPLHHQSISTDSRPTGTVINGPIKLAFKTPAFKSNYNITRGGDFLPTSQSPQQTFALNRSSVELPLTSVCDSVADELQAPSQSAIDTSSSTSLQELSSYSNVLHYETSFQNRKHAMIKNIKFKVPEQYTNSLKNNAKNDQTEVVTNHSVIVNNNNSSDVHWRRRTSQNLVLKN